MNPVKDSAVNHLCGLFFDMRDVIAALPYSMLNSSLLSAWTTTSNLSMFPCFTRALRQTKLPPSLLPPDRPVGHCVIAIQAANEQPTVGI